MGRLTIACSVVAVLIVVIAAGIAFTRKDDQYRKDVKVAKETYKHYKKYAADIKKEYTADLKAAKKAFKHRCQVAETYREKDFKPSDVVDQKI